MRFNLTFLSSVIHSVEQERFTNELTLISEEEAVRKIFLINID